MGCKQSIFHISIGSSDMEVASTEVLRAEHSCWILILLSRRKKEEGRWFFFLYFYCASQQSCITFERHFMKHPVVKKLTDNWWKNPQLMSILQFNYSFAQFRAKFSFFGGCWGWKCLFLSTKLHFRVAHWCFSPTYFFFWPSSCNIWGPPPSIFFCS